LAEGVKGKKNVRDGRRVLMGRKLTLLSWYFKED
jgi:hypothetical protein